MSKTNSTLTVERVRELFDYDPETGVLTWQIRRPNGVKVGSVAGCLGSKGHLQVRADGGRYKAHRLIWLHYYGVWPTAEIDHKNRNPRDNRISNLQDVSSALNQQNRGSQRQFKQIQGSFLAQTAI